MQWLNPSKFIFWILHYTTIQWASMGVLGNGQVILTGEVLNLNSISSHWANHSQEFCGRPMGPVTTMKKLHIPIGKWKIFSSKIDMFFISKPFIYPSFPTNFSIYDQETCCVPHASSNSLSIFFAFHSIHPMSIFFCLSQHSSNLCTPARLARLFFSKHSSSLQINWPQLGIVESAIK